MERALLSLVQDAFAFSGAELTGFDSVLLRLPELRGDAVLEKRRFGTPRSDGEVASRMVALPLQLVSETPVETLSEVLRTWSGQSALDCLILDPPVWLSNEWQDNNVDHTGKLLLAWGAMERLAQTGATRALGIAHAGEAVIDLLLEHASIHPTLNQIEFHPYLNSAPLVRYCRNHGLAVQALRWLGPPDVPTEHQVLRNPKVTQLAQAYGRSPAQIVLSWCLSRVDGVVMDSSEAALAGSLQPDSDFELSPDELALLDGLHCGYRIDRSPSTLASIYGNLADEPMQKRPVETKELEVGCHKILYAPVTRSESFNRRFSFLVWRYLFNLPATMKYALRPPKLSALSDRILSDLQRNGFAISNVGELGCDKPFQRLAEKASTLAGQIPAKGYGHRHDDLAKEFEIAPDVKAAVDAYLRVQTIGAVSVVTSFGRLDVARKQQLWHSDVEDLLTVKVYTFLTDVDGFSGALEYIAESHPKGQFAVRVAELWKQTFVKDPTPAHSFQVPDELIFRHVRPDLLRRLEGPAGTVVVFDARGLHRGGHILGGMRQVAVSSHIAPNNAHPWRRPKSAWSAFWSRFRWETNVTLRETDEGVRRK